MDRVVIIGVGGFANVVADILMERPPGPSAPAPIGFVVEGGVTPGAGLLGLRNLGTLEVLSSVSHEAVVVAIHDNDQRRRCYPRLQERGERILGAIHPAALLARRVTLGPGAIVAAGAIIGVGCSIGQGAILEAGCVLGHGCQVGDFTSIGPGANLGFDVLVKDLASIGAAAAILSGTRIGLDASVADHALVSQPVPEGANVLSTVSPRY